MDFSLFSSSENNKQEVTRVNVEDIIPNPFQPRKDFSQKDIKELAESIENFGVIQPIILREEEDEFQLIAGERRWRAAKMAGVEKIPAIIKDFSRQEVAEIALVENIQRKDLSFIEEAVAYSRILDEFDLTQSELAKKLGHSQSMIANKLRLLNLPVEVKKQLNSDSVTERHARALLQLDNEQIQLKTLGKIKQEKLTVKETLKLVEKQKQDKEGNEEKTGNRKTVFKDLRVFKNSIKHTVNEMKEAGLDVKVKKERNEKNFKYTIILPRQNNKGRD